ncbi:MAG: hypothetical protein U0869_20430 [Chloroflexota bacterium]
MRRTGALVLALALLLPGAAALAQSPSPDASPAADPTQGDLALAAVRAMDSRFADLPDLQRVRIEAARSFDLTPLLAGSWIGVLPTYDNFFDPSEHGPAWTDIGTGRLVEVMLVDGCPETVDLSATADPCAWRHSWIVQVAPDGTTTVVAEGGASDPAA